MSLNIFSFLMDTSSAAVEESSAAIQVIIPQYIPPVLVSEADHVDARIGPFFQAEVPEWKDSSSSSSSIPLAEKSHGSRPKESISTATWCLHMRGRREIISSLSNSPISLSEDAESKLIELQEKTQRSLLSNQDRILSEVSYTLRQLK